MIMISEKNNDGNYGYYSKQSTCRFVTAHNKYVNSSFNSILPIVDYI